MTTQTDSQKMDKDQLLIFNLWKLYWQFLTSLQSLYLDEIQEKLNRKDIISKIVSMRNFFDENGTLDMKGDGPELEEIYFQIPNHKTCVRICISHGYTQGAYLDLLISEEGSEYYSKANYSPEFIPDIRDLFNKEDILIACEWLDSGTISDEAKQVFIKS